MALEHNISRRCGLKITGHKDIDFVDINVRRDTRLFVDPCLIESCGDAFSRECSSTIADYFGKLYAVFERGDRHEIYLHLSHLGERNEARLGYGNGRNGKAKTAEGMMETLSGIKDLIQSGLPMERAIDIPVLTPKFAEDCMSDMLMNILYKHLSEYTIEQCRKHGIPTAHARKNQYYWDGEEHCWKIYEGESLIVDGAVVLLIPKRYVHTRFYYSTGHFFMSKIAPFIQERDATTVAGKQKKPNKKQVRASECQRWGTLLAAALGNAKIRPSVLAEYHLDISKNYVGRRLSDSQLDAILYSKRDEE